MWHEQQFSWQQNFNGFSMWMMHACIYSNVICIFVMFCTEHELSCVRLNKRIFDRMYRSSSGNEISRTRMTTWINKRKANSNYDQYFIWREFCTVHVRVYVDCERELWHIFEQFIVHEYKGVHGRNIASKISSAKYRQQYIAKQYIAS